MSDLDTFTMLPLRMDPQSKAISSLADPPSRALDAELAALNLLHRALLSLDAPSEASKSGGSQSATLVPPPPVPVNPRRSANITKLRETGNTEFRRAHYADAIKYYTLGLQMALTRPAWEPSQLVREEVAALYANRAQAHMALQSWAEGAVDAEASVEAKRAGNAKAWWRRGKCLMEMGRTEEAREWVKRGLEVEGEEAELVQMRKDIEKRLKEEKEKERKLIEQARATTAKKE